MIPRTWLYRPYDSYILGQEPLHERYRNLRCYMLYSGHWTNKGKWTDLSEEEYNSPIFFGFQYFDRAVRLLKKNSWRIE